MCVNDLNLLNSLAEEYNSKNFDKIFKILNPILKGFVLNKKCAEFEDVLQNTWIELHGILVQGKYSRSRGGFLNLAINICFKKYIDGIRKTIRHANIKNLVKLEMERNAKQRAETVTDLAIYDELIKRWAGLIPKLDKRVRDLIKVLADPSVMSLNFLKESLGLNDHKYFKLKNSLLEAINKHLLTDHYGGSKA